MSQPFKRGIPAFQMAPTQTTNRSLGSIMSVYRNFHKRHHSLARLFSQKHTIVIFHEQTCPGKCSLHPPKTKKWNLKKAFWKRKTYKKKPSSLGFHLIFFGVKFLMKIPFDKHMFVLMLIHVPQCKPLSSRIIPPTHVHFSR